MKTFLLMIASLAASAAHPSKPFFQASRDHPYHISVGAVLFDSEGRVACHHFAEINGQKEIYILMRESMEDGEALLTTLERGLQEEFGATAKPIAFLGCLSGFLPDVRLPFEKTTLYIACELIDWNPESRNQDDPEASSLIEWIEPERLISLMQVQGSRFNHRVDLDESPIIQRALSYRGARS